MKWEMGTGVPVRSWLAKTCRNALKRKHLATGLRSHIEGDAVRALVIKGLEMISEELRGFRPMSHAEVDREMAAYFRYEAEARAEERTRLRVQQEKAEQTVAEQRRVSVSGGASAPASSTGSVCSALHAASEEATGDPELDRLLAALKSDAPMTDDAEVSSLATSHDPVPIAEATMSAKVSSAEPARHLSSAVSPSSSDSFPVAAMSDVPDFEDPYRALAAIFRELQVHKDYLAVRMRCCQLAICLNLQGAVAPAFRGWPRGVASFGSTINTLITRDQIVIDYQWCHTKRMPLSPTDDAHKHLLDLDSDFDFKMAWELSGKSRRAAYRASEALCLTPLQQCQTIQLRGSEVRERMDRISGGYRTSGAKSHSELAKATTAIGQWVDDDPRIKPHRLSYERLWLARELLGSGASKQSIAELHGLMLGEQPLDRKTVGDKLERLAKRVDVTAKPTSVP